MTFEEAKAETIKIFGEDSFTESDDDGPEGRRFYVGAYPTEPGAYQGFMGRTWEEALNYGGRTVTGLPQYGNGFRTGHVGATAHFSSLKRILLLIWDILHGIVCNARIE